MVFLIEALFYYFSKVILKPLHSKFGQRVAQNNYFFTYVNGMKKNGEQYV